jgi:LEA14-like dessication related protein
MQSGLRLIAVMTLVVASLASQGCATLRGDDPLQVTVAGIEPLEGQGMEMRMLVKLRIQNPNDAAVDYNGVALEMKLNGKTLATGVSDASGSVPRFGETVIGVPVTVSAFRVLGHALNMMQSSGNGSTTYELKGKLSTSGFNSTRFQTQGEFQLPATAGNVLATGE